LLETRGVYFSGNSDSRRKIHPSSGLFIRINVGYNEELQACQVQQVVTCFALLELSLILDGGTAFSQLQPNKQPSVSYNQIYSLQSATTKQKAFSQLQPNYSKIQRFPSLLRNHKCVCHSDVLQSSLSTMSLQYSYIGQCT
jgi:hypothetical protein